MNIGEAFLDEAENRDFHLIGKPTKLSRSLEVDFDVAALRKAVDVPAKSRCKAGYVEQGG